MKTITRRMRSALVLALSLSLASCGTILHPERKGQTGGRLDVGIVVLDGIGLFFFIIPGVIAYAVDFSNGTIYLPGGKHADRARREVKIVKFDAAHRSPEALRALIRANTGYDLDWNDERLQAIELDRSELTDCLAEVAESGPSAVTASILRTSN